MSKGLPHNDPESLLREAAAVFSAEPGPEIWSGIEQAIRKKDKRRRMAWFFILPVLLVPVLLFTGNPFQQKQDAAAGKQDFTVKASNQAINPKAPVGSNRVEPQLPVQNENPVSAIIQVNKTPVPPETIISSSKLNRKQPVANSSVSNPVSERSVITTPNRNTKKIIAQPKPVPAPATTTSDDFVVSEAATASETEQNIAENEELLMAVHTESPKPELPELANAAPLVPQPVNAIAVQQPQVVKLSLPRRKFRYGLSFSTGAGFRVLQARISGKRLQQTNSYTALGGTRNTDLTSVKNLNHQPGSAYSVGLLANIPLSRKWSIETGLEYQTTGYQMLAYETGGVQLSYTSNGYTVNTVSADLNARYVSSPYYASGSILRRTQLRNRYQFLSVPVLAVYETNPKGKQSVFLKAGLAASYLLGSDAMIYAYESGRYFNSPKEDVYRKFNVSGVLQTGFLFRLKQNQELQIGLDLGFNLLPTHQPEITLREYLYKAAFKVSYLLRF